MPYAAKVLCRGGCGKPVSSGYCETCKATNARAFERKSSAQRGYGSSWQRYREAYLGDHPVCVDPDKRHPGVLMPATDLDHIQAVSGPDDPRFWDRENHQPLCHGCHSFKTVRENRGFGNAARVGVGKISGGDGA
jgi:5-methylcytosine-specific restriction protein A